ncbi:MAG: hypothetical protein BWY31_02872 [Lentisphaerae bacterium ADurb.Bin242]|nr:MAG: hypothetical protein BWY31_02872 [Lentisphaerae bacterium ADurb.Bin242]
MGNYLDYGTLEQRMTAVRLQALCNVEGAELTGLAAAVIERAEALVDSFAAVRYQVPMTRNELLEEWTLRIAEYELYKRGPGGAVPEKIRESYRECLDRLADLSAGKLQFSTAVSQPASARGQSLDVPGGESFFDSKSMNGY